MYHLLWQSVTLHFLFMCFVCFSVYAAIISLNSVNQLIFVMVKCIVLFEVRTEITFRRASASKTEMDDYSYKWILFLIVLKMLVNYASD
jgi:hypothetical protein